MFREVLSFRVQAAAGYYSQLSGMLAGFVFTALILLLSNPPAGMPVSAISAPLFAFLMVFFDLVVASFLYAVVTGDRSETRPDVLGLIASSIFVLAACGMFLTIVWFFQAYGVGPRVVAGARMLFHGVVFISSVWIVKALGDVVSLRDDLDWKSSASSLAWVAPLLLLPVIGAVMRGVLSESSAEVWLIAAVAATALVTAVLAIYSGIISDVAAGTLARLWPRGVETVLAVALGLLLLAYEMGLPH